MVGLTIQIYITDVLKAYEHYKRAFNSSINFTGKGSQDELIHLEFDLYGNKIALAPAAQHEIAKGNTRFPNITMICLNFKDKESLIQAYNVLKEDVHADELRVFPWSELSGGVTDKFGVSWCLSL